MILLDCLLPLIGSFPSFLLGAYNSSNSIPLWCATFLRFINALRARAAYLPEGCFTSFWKFLWYSSNSRYNCLCLAVSTPGLYILAVVIIYNVRLRYPPSADTSWPYHVLVCKDS